METMYTINFTKRELEIICEQLAPRPFNEVAGIISRIQQEYASQMRGREVTEGVGEETIEEVMEEMEKSINICEALEEVEN